MDSNKKNKTVRFNTSSKDLEKFERVKLEDTKVFNMEDSLLKIELTEKIANLTKEFENSTDKETRKELKKEIKELQKELAKLTDQKK
ncbi:hypothetical protein LNO75_01685 [Mycoplasma sp. T363T]|uniref:Uncharacterized protein n=1 Tax=Mycoplasma bradburyae TaxID=2963128 RepID=A0AAW6HR99_9MOLU|nr:hypothetical protein [Mycoplasma bradburyae]MDC4163290.1 hypothetical protein [Mycoplasma bradburyae]MDC4181906.1 hypothetical protein [Mycoplasma bradburyae]MDC4183281.1 hypothetical protein [Mycoplasma bradburyae]UTS70331.1 hypothetical protein NMG68_01155 [Mycoplasma bradburyae]UTS71054.1 hypothetical protein NMG77_01140 [Mycoplasma bradburyae]